MNCLMMPSTRSTVLESNTEFLVKTFVIHLLWVVTTGCQDCKHGGIWHCIPYWMAQYCPFIWWIAQLVICVVHVTIENDDKNLDICYSVRCPWWYDWFTRDPDHTTAKTELLSYQPIFHINHMNFGVILESWQKDAQSLTNFMFQTTKELDLQNHG